MEIHTQMHPAAPLSLPVKKSPFSARGVSVCPAGILAAKESVEEQEQKLGATARRWIAFASPNRTVDTGRVMVWHGRSIISIRPSRSHTLCAKASVCGKL